MHGDHLVNHIENGQLRNDSNLYVVGVISNPSRYHSRYRLARSWIKHMAETPNVVLTIVETAFGDRHHELKKICEELKVNFVPLRTSSSIWIKESMMNIGMRHVLVKYPSARYLAWVDADVHFRDPNWALETVHQLQHFDVVQPWSDCADLGPQGGIFQHFRSFGFQHQKRRPKFRWKGDPYEYAHSGFAWACTRRFWEAVQGLIDFAILGSADHHQAWAMIGEARHTIHKGMSKAFFRKIYEWEQRAMRITKGEVGFTPGRIEHHFHGPKKRRYYRERWQILIDHDFNPDTDVMHDDGGIIQLCGKPKLEQAIHMYNVSRMEDSIEQD